MVKQTRPPGVTAGGDLRKLGGRPTEAEGGSRTRHGAHVGRGLVQFS